MRKSTKIWLIIASALTLLGLVVSATALAISGFDFKILSQHQKTVTFEIDEAFENIVINADTEDIVFLPSDSEKTKVVFCVREDYTPAASVKDSTLSISVNAEKLKWYQYISMFSFYENKITVYLPKTAYTSLTINSDTGDIEIPKAFKFKSVSINLSTGDVNCGASAEDSIAIKVSTGDVKLKDFSANTLKVTTSTGDIEIANATVAGNIDLTVSTGKTTLSVVTAKNLASNGSTGNLVLNNTTLSGKLSVERSTGDVKFNRFDAAEIKIVTDTGDVSGSLGSEKIFFVSTDTGNVDIPKTTTGGKCEITTDTGDVKITIAK